MNPTPEEKCEDTRCKKCKKGGWSISHCEYHHQRSPSPEARKNCHICRMPEPHHDEFCSAGFCIHKVPEARVDWEKQSEDIFYHPHFAIIMGSPEWCDYIVKKYAKALSAAFEKGREAR